MVTIIFELDLLENALNDNIVASVNHLYKWLYHITEWDNQCVEYANKVWNKEEERSRLIRLATKP